LKISDLRLVVVGARSHRTYVTYWTYSTDYELLTNLKSKI